MSVMYDNYLTKHISNVRSAFEWIKAYISYDDFFNLFPEASYSSVKLYIECHDLSKYDPEEYDAYDKFFYGRRTEEVKYNFNRAWLHHIHNNPHHWQYWVLFHDDPVGNHKYTALDMPDRYIIEMVCDWWSFSWQKYTEANSYDPTEGLYEIFDWYDNHATTMALSLETRRKVEKLLELIKNELDRQKDKYSMTS